MGDALWFVVAFGAFFLLIWLVTPNRRYKGYEAPVYYFKDLLLGRWRPPDDD